MPAVQAAYFSGLHAHFCARYTYQKHDSDQTGHEPQQINGLARLEEIQGRPQPDSDREHDKSPETLVRNLGRLATLGISVEKRSHLLGDRPRMLHHSLIQLVAILHLALVALVRYPHAHPRNANNPSIAVACASINALLLLQSM